MGRKAVRLLALILVVLSVFNITALAGGVSAPRGDGEQDSVKVTAAAEKSGAAKKNKKSKKKKKTPKQSQTAYIDNSTDIPDGTYTLKNGDYTVKTSGKVSASVTKVTVKNGKASAVITVNDKNRRTLDAGGTLFKASSSTGRPVFSGVPIAPGKTVTMLAISEKDSVQLSVKVTFHRSGRTVDEPAAASEDTPGDAAAQQESAAQTEQAIRAALEEAVRQSVSERPAREDRRDWTPVPKRAMPKDRLKDIAGGTEPAEGENTFTVSVSSSSNAFAVAETAVVTLLSDGSYAMQYTVTSARSRFVATGDKASAQAHTIPWYRNESSDSNGVYTIPVKLNKNGSGRVSVTYQLTPSKWSDQSFITVTGPLMDSDASAVSLSPITLGSADYSAVNDALAAVPEDLSIYTDESVAALDAAVDAVDYTLDEDEQDRVDAMAAAVRQAIDALEPIVVVKELLILKADGTEYEKLRVTGYEAVTDGKKIKIVFKTEDKDYIKGIQFKEVSKISKIKKCYKRAKDSSFTVTVPYESRGEKLPLVALMEKGWLNEQFYMQVPSDPAVTDKTIKDAPMKSCTNKIYDPDKPEDSLDGTTGAVDNATDLPDGEYQAEKFTFSGGSGRAKIFCEKVIVKNGKSFAVIAFGSESYVYIKAGGGKYMTTQGGGRSRATIPVKLDAINTIIGMTTAMSQPHEIEYSIFIHVNAPGNKTQAQEDRMVPGLTYKSTDQNTAAELFTIHRYEGGFVIVKVAGVGRYLVVPEGKEAPDVVEEDIFVIKQPVKNVYAAERDLFDTLLGIDEARVRALVTIAGFETEDAELIAGGGSSDVNFSQLVRSRCSFGILPARFADARVNGRDSEKGDAVTIEGLTDEEAADLARVFEGFKGLGIPPFVDRSTEETSDAAKLEWLRAYGVLLGCEKQAEAAFRSGSK